MIIDFPFDELKRGKEGKYEDRLNKGIILE